MLEDADVVPVVEREALARSRPQESGAVADDRRDRLGREPALATQPLEDELIGGRPERSPDREEEDDDRNDP